MSSLSFVPWVSHPLAIAYMPLPFFPHVFVAQGLWLVGREGLFDELSLGCPVLHLQRKKEADVY